MRLVNAALAILIVTAPVAVHAQDRNQPASTSQASSSVSLPRLINLGGMLRPADGQPVARVETVTFAVYADETGGTPIWQETQEVEPDAAGKYAVLLGATQRDGVPVEVFASGEARWVGMIWPRGGEAGARRWRLTFVPYAVRAADADTLGGRPASAYALAPVSDGAPPQAAGTSAAAGDPEANTIFPGGTNQLAKYVNSTDLTPSAVYEAGGMVGIGTTAPADALHVQFNDTSGAFTGYSVRNLGSGANSYSGMLFYDQAGVLGQFQGFNNSTHEYRINNIARNGSNAFNGSINFMVGGSSKFFVASNGNIGIGTSAPATNLEVSSSAFTNIFSTTYGNAPGAFIGRHARGTSAAPTAALNGDVLVSFGGQGFGTTRFGGTKGGMSVLAAENWTDAAQGTWVGFAVTPAGTTATFGAMALTPSGDLGIGTTAPAGALEISRSSGYDVVFTAYAGEANLLTRKARGGDPAAPTAALVGNELGSYLMAGYGATAFGEGKAGMGAYAGENFTDTAQGAGLFFVTTPVGTTADDAPMVITPSGHAGIGPVAFDVNGLPIVPDRLQVVGDIRVGTTGTNGCVKDFSGTGIVGTCSSDRRLKQNITPFGPVLDRVAALQPVHYFWRAAEFPDRHFGDSQAAGLIAQDVEQVLPELVVTESDGFKAVKYSQLPLLTIQAVKELKAENDALKQQVADLDGLKAKVAEVEPLQRRVTDLERRLTDMLALLNHAGARK